ncbi:MAG: hypothetical protein Kow0068_05410 [Marinilabiliales bacterium]
MKKLIIITYYFPPCNLTSANRTYSWANYLHNFGYYPIIITRNWNVTIKTEIDIARSTGKEVEHLKYNNYEVFYLPYKQSLRDKILVTHGKNKMIFLRKILTFFNQLSQFAIGLPNSFDGIYQFANKYLKKHSDEIDLLIVSANPFVLFKYGMKLSKKYKKKWIADYRDDWTTTDWERPKGIFNNIIFTLEKIKERKWVSSASIVTSVSDYYTQKISNYTGVNGYVIINGFFHEEFFNLPKINPYQTFTITYIGMLYNDQKIEIFIDGFKEFIKQRQYQIKIRLLFAGLGFIAEQKERVIKAMEGFENFIEITNWLSRQDVIKTILQSHVLLLVPAENIKGVPSSKIYEYLASGKSVILCPNDNDIMESILKESFGNYICETKNDVIEKLNYLWNKYKSNYDIDNVNNSLVYKYSRENQTRILAELINKIINDNC